MKGKLKEALSGELPEEELRKVSNSYDIIGDIAVLRLNRELEGKRDIIAKAVMRTHKRVKTVLNQVSPVSDAFRLRRLEWVAGEHKTETEHKEFGCIFRVDLQKAYFSPRLSHERMRITRLVQPGEVVVNMFAGVGCYSILIAKHSKVFKVYSIDLNPEAVRYMRINISKNQVEDRVEAIEGDAEVVIRERLSRIADRVLMPLPEMAFKYLPSALLALKEDGGWIHYYDFEYGKKPYIALEKVKEKVSAALEERGVAFSIPFGRIVRTTGPHWYQIVLDVGVGDYGNK